MQAAACSLRGRGTAKADRLIGWRPRPQRSTAQEDAKSPTVRPRRRRPGRARARHPGALGVDAPVRRRPRRRGARHHGVASAASPAAGSALATRRRLRRARRASSTRSRSRRDSTSAVLCGVSFGGWVSVRYAARRPERVQALVLASAPGPAFQPDARQQRYIRAPRLLLPAFAADVARAHAARGAGLALPRRARALALPRGQLAAMARVPDLAVADGAADRGSRCGTDFTSERARASPCPRWWSPASAGSTASCRCEARSEYLDAGPAARASVVLERTGHIGCVTRPREFARLVRSVRAEVRARPPATRREDQR